MIFIQHYSTNTVAYATQLKLSHETRCKYIGLASRVCGNHVFIRIINVFLSYYTIIPSTTLNLHPPTTIAHPQPQSTINRQPSNPPPAFKRHLPPTPPTLKYPPSWTAAHPQLFWTFISTCSGFISCIPGHSEHSIVHVAVWAVWAVWVSSVSSVHAVWISCQYAFYRLCVDFFDHYFYPFYIFCLWLIITLFLWK